MDELLDIFPPPAPGTLEAGTGWVGVWPLWGAALVLLVLALGVLWRRRLALEGWWLARALAAGRREPRRIARQALSLMQRAFGASLPQDLAPTRARLDADSYGLQPPDRVELARALAQLRARL